MRLLLITDTRIQKVNSGYFAFNSVVNELNYIKHLFSEVTWIGYDFTDCQLDGTLIIVDQEIVNNIVLLPRSGGKRLVSKLDALFKSVLYLVKLRKYIKAADVIHVRGPSIPMFCSLIYAFSFKRKIWWFKYANDWSDKSAPITWLFQRFILRSLKGSKVCVNGSWLGEPSHVINFENPCILGKNKSTSDNIININKVVDFLFVGRIEEKKGYKLCIDAFNYLSKKHKGISLKIIGDGPESLYLKDILGKLEWDCNIEYIGNVSKDEVFHFMRKSKYLILPTTASEGFPKVIAESWYNHCIPIVFPTSAIGQYVINNVNGFISNDKTLGSLISMMEEAILCNNEKRLNLLQNGFNMSLKFTYQRYILRIQSEILK